MLDPHLPCGLDLPRPKPCAQCHGVGRSLNFCNATTPPYASDLEGGRRSRSCADFNNAVRLCQSLNTLHFFYGYPVEPQDLPPETRHLDSYHAHATLSDKVWRPHGAWVEGGARSATERAHRIWKQILAEYRPPEMDAGIREELDAYVARRKEEYARVA